jgi:hypothetical protein
MTAAVEREVSNSYFFSFFFDVSSMGHSALGQLVQPLNKGFINNLVAVAPSNLNVALNDAAIRQMVLRPPPGIKGLATRVARTAHASPRAKPTRPPRRGKGKGWSLVT